MRYQTLSMAIAAAIDAFAAANGISRAQVAKGFSVAPAATQRMYDEIAQSSELLQKINVQGKEEVVGEVIGLASGLVGSHHQYRPAGQRAAAAQYSQLERAQVYPAKNQF